MVEAYKKYWNNYFNFSGRTNRSDYWWTILANFLVSMMIGIFLGIFGLSYSYEITSTGFHFTGSGVGLSISRLWSLVNLIPGTAMFIRRLHDINKTGWLLALLFVPLVNIVAIIVLFVYTLLPSVDEGNQYK